MFYHVEIVTTNGTTIQNLFPHSTKDEAIAAFHYALYYNMNNAECSACLAMVIDGNGAVYASEKYTKGTEEASVVE